MMSPQVPFAEQPSEMQGFGSLLTHRHSSAKKREIDKDSGADALGAFIRSLL